jgi:folate-binding protein YgfZ
MPSRFCDLSARAKLRVTGTDRSRFLNGQTTNDLRRASVNTTQESCVLNAKGHLEAHLFLFATDDAIWIDTDSALRETLPARLERYIIADDVLIEDKTDDFALFHVLSTERPEGIDTEFCPKSRRLNCDGWDLWVPGADAKKMRGMLDVAYTAISESEWEVLRVESGISRWGRELTPDIIPPEANLEMRAIDYEKGCYIGQEVISRMKMSGQTRQRLSGVIATDNVTLVSETDLKSAGKVVGKITSAVFSERLHRQIALAIIKRGFNGPGTELIAGESTVRVVPLPFI